MQDFIMYKFLQKYLKQCCFFNRLFVYYYLYNGRTKTPPLARRDEKTSCRD